MTTVLFLGLGHMGGPMAANLAAAGHRVLGFDLVPEALEQLDRGPRCLREHRVAQARGDIVQACGQVRLVGRRIDLRQVSRHFRCNHTRVDRR